MYGGCLCSSLVSFTSPGHESDDDRNQIMKSNEFHVKRWMFVLPLFYWKQKRNYHYRHHSNWLSITIHLVFSLCFIPTGRYKTIPSLFYVFRYQEDIRISGRRYQEEDIRNLEPSWKPPVEWGGCLVNI